MKSFCLIILDGFGIAPKSKANAILYAKMPFYDSLLKKYNHTLLKASGTAVGLPPNKIGNSEVGHLNIGSGSLVIEEYLRINNSIKDGSFYKNKVLNDLLNRAQRGTLHVWGLVSDKGVHSDIAHLIAILKAAKRKKIRKISIHAVTDGRDTAPKLALKYINFLERKLKYLPGEIATVSGRFYTMDRDHRYHRLKKGYDAIVKADGLHEETAKDAVNAAYNREETDEFILPTVIGDYGGMLSYDSVVGFNFRPDRARELTHSIADAGFSYFSRRKIRPYVACMTPYDSKFPLPTLFPLQKNRITLGKVISKKGIRQLRIAETEKYAHVTYFFNGLEETPLPKEERIVIPSSKVSTYDLHPKMSAPKITETAVHKIHSRKYPAIIINYANADMVAHTGNFEKTVEAVEYLDLCLKKVVTAALEQGIICFITADHGNAEEMKYPDGTPMTAHSLNEVPFIITAGSKGLKKGLLSDVAPTILEVVGLKKPAAMTGKSLLKK